MKTEQLLAGDDIEKVDEKVEGYDYRKAYAELLSNEHDGSETIAELVEKKEIEKLLERIPPDFDLAMKNGVSNR